MPRSALTGSKIKPAEPAGKSAKEKAKKVIKVYLNEQIVEAFEGAKRIFRFECITGDIFGPTDRGKFHIGRKYENYRSEKYNVDMDYAMFFTLDGKAFHKYHGSTPWGLMRNTKRYLTDLVGSHGCVRLQYSDAKALFEWTPYRTEVIIS